MKLPSLRQIHPHPALVSLQAGPADRQGRYEQFHPQTLVMYKRRSAFGAPELYNLFLLLILSVLYVPALPFSSFPAGISTMALSSALRYCLTKMILFSSVRAMTATAPGCLMISRLPGFRSAILHLQEPSQ